MWEIIDDNGTIHSGSEDEMRHAFDVMTNSENFSEDEVEKFDDVWDGDIKLIEIHAISR